MRGGLPRLPSSTFHLPSPGSLAGLNKFSTRGVDPMGWSPSSPIFHLPSSTSRLPWSLLWKKRKGKAVESISVSLLEEKERKGFQRQLCVSFEREGKGNAFKTTCDSLRKKRKGKDSKRTCVSLERKDKERLSKTTLSLIRKERKGWSKPSY